MQAVDYLAAEMKARLRSKYKQGWTGWQSMDKTKLGRRLKTNAEKAAEGDSKSLVDTENLAMMIKRHC